MTALLLLLAGSVGHVMQNGDAMAERWLGIRIGTGQPVVATREPRLIGYVGTFQTAALPGRDDAVARMDMAPPLLTELQPGLTGIAPEHGPLTE